MLPTSNCQIFSDAPPEGKDLDLMNLPQLSANNSDFNYQLNLNNIALPQKLL